MMFDVAAFSSMLQKAFGENGMGKAKHRYQKSAENHGRASECIGCGKCEKHCPQHIDIREKLKDIVKEFES